MSGKPAGELKAALGGRLTPGLETLGADDQRRLAQELDEARARQNAELVRALEAALKHVPMLLRGAVRKVLLP